MSTTGIATMDLGVLERTIILTTADASGEARRLEAQMRLATWLSPGFPVGAFAFSHGLESAVAERRIRDRDTLCAWIETLVHHGSGWNDLVIFAASYRAAEAGDEARLAETAVLAVALGGSKERRDETVGLGTAFAAAARPWSGEGEGALVAAGERADAYSVAVARVAAANRTGLGASLAAFAQGFAGSLVASATRLVPLGQSDAVKALHRLEPALLTAAAKAAGSTISDLGSAAILSDIAAMRHETLSTRLFRT